MGGRPLALEPGVASPLGGGQREEALDHFVHGTGLAEVGGAGAKGASERSVRSADMFRS